MADCGGMILFRIEALRGPRTGHGPYNGEPLTAYPYSRHAAYGRHTAALQRGMDHVRSGFGVSDTTPPPELDPGIGRRMAPGEFCAFESVEQLLAWFPLAAVREICATGYFGVVRYKIAPRFVTCGEYQVLAELERSDERLPVPVSSLAGPGGLPS